MRAAVSNSTPTIAAGVYALSPDYKPDLPPDSVLRDQTLPAAERLAQAQDAVARELAPLMEAAQQGATPSQEKCVPLIRQLTWLCGPDAAAWVEEHYPQVVDIFTKYQLKIHKDGWVDFTLPKGGSYLKLFEEANEYCRKHLHQRRGDAVKKDALSSLWKRRPSARTLTKEAVSHSILGVVPNSTDKTRKQQEALIGKRGLSLPTLEAAVAAAALYYCKTGKDLLRDKWVRTAAPGLGLKSYALGLYVSNAAHVNDDVRNAYVSCAASRNPKT